jgi:hypothetical protein
VPSSESTGNGREEHAALLVLCMGVVWQWSHHNRARDVGELEDQCFAVAFGNSGRQHTMTLFLAGLLRSASQFSG